MGVEGDGDVAFCLPARLELIVGGFETRGRLVDGLNLGLDWETRDMVSAERFKVETGGTARQRAREIKERNYRSSGSVSEKEK